MKRMFAVCLGLLCGLAVTNVHAQKTVFGSGGSLNAPTVIGQNITIAGVNLRNGGTASISCPVTFAYQGRYAWNWACAHGTLTYDGSNVATVQGYMTYACSGGGRYSPMVCWHTFFGSATANGFTGIVLAAAKGGAGNVSGTVTAFTATW